jgi:hypothetical protein
MTVALEAGGGALDLKELDLALPPAAAGKGVRSVKPLVAGVPAAASVRRHGGTIRVLWTKPIRVEPGKPLTLAVAF